jgi:hypothetical protein
MGKPLPRPFSGFPRIAEAAIYASEDMETIARFYKAEEAYLFRSFLESEGITAHVFDEYTPHANWLYTHSIGGIRVVADKEDAPQAAELYRKYEENVNAGPAVVGDVKAWPVVLLVSIMLGFPMFLLGRKKSGQNVSDA